jgi:hypothetical protein
MACNKKTGAPVWAIRLSNGARTRDFPQLPPGNVGFLQSAKYNIIILIYKPQICGECNR